MTDAAREALPAGSSRRGVWQNRDFLALWGGQSISELGSGVTIVALPLIAVLRFRASAFEVGLLSAAGTVPFAVIALPAGLVVDRLAKRWLMLGCNAARTLLIGSVPAAYVAAQLTLGQLYVVAVLAGVCTVLFDVAYQSYVPSLVSRAQLTDANGKLGVSESLAQIAGPSLGGALYGWLKAGALSADAISYALSCVSLLLIRAKETRRTAQGPARPNGAALRGELIAGLSFVARHPALRKIAACTATANLFLAMVLALQIVFVVRYLDVRSAAETGALVAAAGAGGVAGGLMVGRLQRAIGSARLTVISILVFGVPLVLIPLAYPGWRVGFFAVGQACLGFSGMLYDVGQVSYRQAICAPGLLGRMNAAIRWLAWGTIPLGGLLGGLLAATVGVRATLWIAVTGTWAAGWFVFFSPLRGMRDFPDGQRS
jgi:MFS family permease